MNPENIVTRFPPSPTGYLHIGRARTALFNYLYAKKNKGKMVFRIEDTDKERSKKEYDENIIECLAWLKIGYDEGPFRQSERGHIYKTYIQKLIDNGSAFISKEEDNLEGEGSTNNPGKEKRKEVIRFKNPNKKIKFTDIIRGEIEFDTTDLGDFVIAKSLDEPLYHLTVVVDDHEMGITHVIRGEDGISNTPRQILLQEGIGAQRPLYAHLPLILAADKSKLSGRHGAIAVTEYRNQGYLPEAILNFLALLGWNPGTDQEIFNMDELVSAFDLEKVHKSGAIFNLEKLNWFNRHYIQKLSDTDFADYAASFLPEWMSTHSPLFLRALPLLREKIAKFADLTALFDGAGEMSFMKGTGDYPSTLLLWKKDPDPIKAREHLTRARNLLNDLNENSFTPEEVKNTLWSYAETHGKGDVLWPLRVALTGKEKSPDPFASAAILGKKESLERVDKAIVSLTASSS